jgi:uncharacterized membrane protein
LAVKDRAGWLAAGVLCAVAFFWMEWIALTQWLSGRWYLADVGNIHYCLVNTLAGRFMHSPLTGGNHFAWHFTPFLLLLAPVVGLSAYPVPLVTGYVMALSLCPLPIYYMARERGLGVAPAVACGYLFLANHFTGSLQLANHFEVWYVLFALCALAAFGGAARWFWSAVALALMVKEDAAVWLLALAVWMWLTMRGVAVRGRAARLAGVCVAYGVVAAAAMALAAVGQPGDIRDYAERAAGWALSREGLSALGLLVASFGLLPLAGGREALLLLAPVPVVLVGFPFMRNLLYYYSYPFLPFLALATVSGAAAAARWLERHGWPRGRTMGALAVYMGVVGTLQLALPTRTDGYRRVPFEVTSRDRYRLEVARERLPREGPAVLQFGLWGVTPTRADARPLTAEPPAPEAWVFLDLRAPHGLPRDAFIAVARRLMDDAGAGRRRLVHERSEIYVFSPVLAEEVP